MAESFAIIGAGAIGGLLGAHLVRAGHPVLFVDVNAEHVAAIKRKGLTIEGSRGRFSVTAEAVTPDQLRRPLARAIMAVKTPHTRTALDTLVPFLAADGFVVAMQNGLGALEVAERVGGARTIAAAFTFGGFYKEPGAVVFSSPGSFRIGRLGAEQDPRLESLRDAFSALQPVEITDNILGFIWTKIAIGAVYFATALVDADVCIQLDRPPVRRLFARIAGEIADIAEAEGVRLEALDGFHAAVFADGGRDRAGVEANWQSQRAYWRGQVQQRTGIWRDLAVHKRKTEAVSLLGPVIARARARQLAAPLLERLVGLITEVEAGRRQGWELLEELGAKSDGGAGRVTDVPARMRAAIYRRTGPAAEVLEFVDMDVPRCKRGEVLVAVAVSAVNPHDTKLRAGWLKARENIAVVPHGDGAGRICAVGESVDPKRIGERVWFFGAGHRSGATGSAAQFATIDASDAIPLPERTDYAIGACLGIPAVTAHRALFWDGPIAGQVILIAGGAGAVAGYAIQMAKAAGATVIATASTLDKTAHAIGFGADHTINYRDGDAAAQILALTRGEGVDRIVEVDFGANVRFNAEIIKPGGIIASYSSTREPNPTLPYYEYSAKAATIHFVRDAAIPPAAREAAIADITAALERGSLKHPAVTRFPFERIAAAHERQESGANIGKILVDVADMDVPTARNLPPSNPSSPIAQ